jgi:hypothetical protein
MQALLDKAIEEYRRKRFLEEVNAAYATLRQNPDAWAAVEQERAEWDATLEDGLTPAEIRTEKRKELRKSGRRKSRSESGPWRGMVRRS